MTDMQDFAVFRELRESEETSSWNKSIIATSAELGNLVIISRLNKEKFLKHYTYIPGSSALPPEQLKKLEEKALIKYNAEVEQFVSANKKVIGLNHPNIVSVLNASRDNETGEDIIVREFFAGSSIYDITEGLIVESMIPLFLGIIDAVDFIHRHKMLHLNLKPKRLRVTEESTGYIVKLTDYGYAADFGTINDYIYGVPAFSAPEVVFKQNDKIGETSDLYSIGAIIYYCMTRVLPFPEREGVKEIHKLVEIIKDESEPMKPSDRNPNILEMPYVGGIKYKKEPEKVKQLEELVMGLIKENITERPIKTARALQLKILSVFPEAQAGKAVSSASITTSV